MPQTTCPECGATLNVPESAIGKMKPCPRCGQTIALSSDKPPALIVEALPVREAHVQPTPRGVSKSTLLHGAAYLSLLAIAVAGWFDPIGGAESRAGGSESLRVGANGNFENVATQNLQIVDPEGRKRAVIGTIDGVVAFALMGEDGKTRFVTGINESGEVSQELTDVNGVSRVTSVVNAKNAGSILLRDSEGRLRVQIATVNEGGMGVVLYKTNGAVSDAFVTN